MIQQQILTPNTGNALFSGVGQRCSDGIDTTGNKNYIRDIKPFGWNLVLGLFLCLAGLGCARSHAPEEQALIELTRVVYEQEAGAIVTELVIPDVDDIKQLSRIELLISSVDHAGTNEPKFGVMLNHSDRVDPIPPGNFGIIIDPVSDDRSIKNVASAAGVPGRFDQVSPHGTLLKQSVSGVVNGNLGISIWIAPRDWDTGRYAILARATERKHRQTPWQPLAEFNYSGEGVERIAQNTCLVKPIFIDLPYEAVMPFDQVRSVTLIRYEKHPQDEGVTIKRWPGDTASQYKYVEIEKQQLKLSNLQGGEIPLEPGLYQFKHNSVSGQPPSGYYGESNFFEVEPGEESVDIKVLLYPAI